MTPEARARQSIDVLLIAAGWAVQDLKQQIGQADTNFTNSQTLSVSPLRHTEQTRIITEVDLYLPINCDR